MIYSIAASVVSFLFLYFFIRTGLVIAFILAASVYVAFLLITSTHKRKLIGVGGLSSDPGKIIKYIEDNIVTIKKLSDKITKKEITSITSDIISELKEIADNIKKDPSDAKPGGNALIYYIDTTVKILNLYTGLHGKKVLDENMKTSIQRTESVMVQIRDVLRQENIRLLENDFLDLDTEIKVLEKTIKFEGRVS